MASFVTLQGQKYCNMSLRYIAEITLCQVVALKTSFIITGVTNIKKQTAAYG